MFVASTIQVQRGLFNIRRVDGLKYKSRKKRSKIQKSPYQYVLSWFEAKFEGFNDLDQFMAQKEVERKAKEAENNAASNEEEND